MAGLDLMQILNIIQTQYPDAMSILQQPGVAKVYIDYINSQNGVGDPWTQAQFAAAIRGTEWYQGTDSATRDWQVLQSTDPATARTKASQVQQMMTAVQAQTGINLSTDGGFSSESFQFFTKAVAEGWDANQIKYQLLAQKGGTAGNTGELGANAAQVKSLANDYGVPLSDQSAMQWATQLSQGSIDQNAIKGYLIEQAKSLFPSLNDALDRGVTVRQYAAPYLQIAQQELGIDPSTVSLTDQKWLSALNQVDPKTGARTSMSLSDWLGKVRSDPIYGYAQTTQGKQSSAQLAAALQAKFGTAA